MTNHICPVCGDEKTARQMKGDSICRKCHNKQKPRGYDARRPKRVFRVPPGCELLRINITDDRQVIEPFSLPPLLRDPVTKRVVGRRFRDERGRRCVALKVG